MKHLRLLNALTQTGMYCLAASQTSLAGTIAVNAAVNVSDSGRSDIEVTRGFCRGATRAESGSGTGSTSARYMSRLSLAVLRGINVDNADSGNKVDSNGTFVAGQRLQDMLNDAKINNYVPHVIVGQQKPAYLPANAWTWSSSTWAQYRDYAVKFVRYATREFQNTGFSTITFEVGNEIDVEQNPNYIWTQQNPGGNGSQQRYNHLKIIYEIWQAAVTQVASEDPSRQVLIEGPNLTTYGIYFAPFNWANAFIDDVANNKWRLDHLTYHAYGDNAGAVGNAPPHPNFGNMKDMIQDLRNKLNSRGFNNVWIVNTEWGPSSFTDDGSSLSRINYTHEGAAWTIALLKDIVSFGLARGSNAFVRDNIGAASAPGNPSTPSYIYARDTVEYPKPVYNACKMLGLLPGARKSVSLPTGQPNLVAIASGNRHSAGVIVANYKYQFDYPNQSFTDLSVPESVSVQFSGLPSGPAIVEQYLIDANTSNLAKYLDAGQTPSVNGTKLQRVASTNVTVANGSVTLPAVTLSKSAVSLWIVQSLNSVPNGVYKLVPRHSLKTLSVEGASLNSGAKIQQWLYSGGSNQQWNVSSLGNGYYKVISKHTGDKGLEPEGGNTGNGTRVVQSQYIGKSSQQWQITAIGSGFYKLTPRNAIEAGLNRALDVDITNSADGINGMSGIIWDNGGNENQVFRLDDP
jgi:hypothetical protein